MVPNLHFKGFYYRVGQCSFESLRLQWTPCMLCRRSLSLFGPSLNLCCCFCCRCCCCCCSCCYCCCVVGGIFRAHIPLCLVLFCISYFEVVAAQRQRQRQVRLTGIGVAVILPLCYVVLPTIMPS